MLLLVKWVVHWDILNGGVNCGDCVTQVSGRSQSTEHDRSLIPGCRSRSQSTKGNHSPAGHHHGNPSTERDYFVRPGSNKSIFITYSPAGG